MGDALKGYLDEPPPHDSLCEVCKSLYSEEGTPYTGVGGGMSGEVPKTDVHNAVHESGNPDNWSFGQFGSMRRKFSARSPGVNIFTIAERLMQPPCYLVVDSSIHSMFFRKLIKVCKELLSMEFRPLEVPLDELRQDYVKEGCTILLSEFRHNFQTAKTERMLTIYPNPIPWSRMLTIFLLVFVEDNWYASSGRFSVPEKIRALVEHVYGPPDPRLVLVERGAPSESLFLPELDTYEQSTLLQNVARKLHAQCKEWGGDFTLNIQQYVTWIKVYRRRDDLVPLLEEETLFVRWRKHPAIRYLIKALRAFGEFIRGNHCDGFAPLFVSVLDTTVQSVDKQMRMSARRRAEKRADQRRQNAVKDNKRENMSKEGYVPGFDADFIGEDLEETEKRILDRFEKEKFRDLRSIKWVDFPTVLHHLKENMLWGEIQCFVQDFRRMTEPLVFSVEEKDADSVLYTLKTYAEAGRDEVSHIGNFTFDSYRVYRYYKSVTRGDLPSSSSSMRWMWVTFVMVEKTCWQFIKSKMIEDYASCQENMLRSNMVQRMKYYPLGPVVANEYFYGQNPISAIRAWIHWVSRNAKERRHMLSCVRSTSEPGFATEMFTHSILKAMFPNQDALYEGILDMWPGAYPKQVLHMSTRAVYHWKNPVLHNKEGVPHSPPGFIWPFLSLWMHSGEHRVSKFVLKDAELVEDYEDVVAYIHKSASEAENPEDDSFAFPQIESDLPVSQMDLTNRIRHSLFNGDALGHAEDRMFADLVVGVAKENSTSVFSTHRHWMRMCMETQSSQCLRHVYPSEITLTPFSKVPFRNNFHVEYLRNLIQMDYVSRGYEVSAYHSRTRRAHHPAHRNVTVLDHLSWSLTHDFSCALERVLIHSGHGMYGYPKGDAKDDIHPVFPFRGNQPMVMGSKWTSGTFEHDMSFPLLEDTRDINNTKVVMSDACVMMTLTADEEKFEVPGHASRSSYLFNNMYTPSTADTEMELCEGDMRRWRGFQIWWHKCLDYCNDTGNANAKPEDVKFKTMCRFMRLSKRVDGLGNSSDFEDLRHGNDGWATPHDLFRHVSNSDISADDGLVHTPGPGSRRPRPSPESNSSPSPHFVPILSPAPTPNSKKRRDPPTLQLPKSVVKKIKRHTKPAKIKIVFNPNSRVCDNFSDTE